MRAVLRFFRPVSYALVSLLAICSASADDEPGTKDSPVVGRYQGASIVYQKNADFDEAALLTAPHDYSALLDRDAVTDRSGAEWLKLEGRISKTRYEIPEGRSSVEVTRNYQNALKTGGFESVFDCADKACFTGKLQDPYLLGQQLDSENTVSTTYFDHARYTLMKRSQGASDVFVAVLTGEDKQRTTAFVEVVEVKAIEGDKVQVLKASEMDKAISSAGKVSLYGLLFDYDKDVLKPDSKATLDEIAKLLTDKPDLRLQIVGHTDNKGTPDYNLNLSTRRAASVVTALTRDYAISADRLTSSGAGLTAPIASNDTDEGRAKNRRVELVAQ